MMTELGLMRQRESYKSRHATTSRPGDGAKLKKLRTFKQWRLAGYEAQVLLKRLKTTRESLKKWAVELGFEMGGTL